MSSVVRVPTEVIKTRRQVGAMGGVGLRSVVASSGVAGLFVGYGSFLLRDLPFDAIEFAGYESLKKAWGEMKGEDGATAVEAAALGSIAGGVYGRGDDAARRRQDAFDDEPGRLSRRVAVRAENHRGRGRARDVQGRAAARALDRIGRRVFLFGARDGARRSPSRRLAALVARRISQPRSILSRARPSRASRSSRARFTFIETVRAASRRHFAPRGRARVMRASARRALSTARPARASDVSLDLPRVVAGQPTRATHPHVIASAADLTPGVSRAEYAARRAALARAMPPHSAAIFAAAPALRWPGTVIPAGKYRQDADFAYYTGVTQPDCVAVVERGRTEDDVRYALIVPKRCERHAQWDGERIDARAGGDGVRRGRGVRGGRASGGVRDGSGEKRARRGVRGLG